MIKDAKNKSSRTTAKAAQEHLSQISVKKEDSN